MSQINVNTIKDKSGFGAPNFPAGLTVTGVITATTLNQNLSGDLTVSNNFKATGIATATNFKTGSTNVHSTGVELANINTGGSTATFGGPISGTSATLSGALSGTTASFSGNVSVGGTLTYEDVTNIDSVGVITARNGIDCNGDLDVAGNLSIVDKIIHTGDTNTAIRFPANDNITFETNGSERLRISAGTAGTCILLTGDRVDSTNKTLRLTLNHYSFNTVNQINILGATTGSGFNRVHIGGNDDSTGDTCATEIKLYTGANSTTTNGTERLRIASAGQIGVGGANYGTSGQVLKSGGASAAPTWGDVSGGPEVFSDSTNSVGTIANGGTIKEWGITPTKAWTRAIFGWSGAYRAQSNGHVYIDVKARVNNGSWGNIHTCGANTPQGSGAHNWNQGFTVTGELHADGTRLTGAANHQVDILLTCSSSMSIDHANDTGHDHNYWVMFFA